MIFMLDNLGHNGTSANNCVMDFVVFHSQKWLLFTDKLWGRFTEIDYKYVYKPTMASGN